MHLPFVLPSHLSSLLPFRKTIQKQTKKMTGTSHKKVYRMKTSTCRNGTLKTSQTSWDDTFTLSLPLVPFCQQYTPKILYMHLAYSNSNEHSNHHCSLHSFSHNRQSISATFSSNKISQHNLKLPTYHTDPALLTACAYKTDYICHAH